VPERDLNPAPLPLIHRCCVIQTLFWVLGLAGLLDPGGFIPLESRKLKAPHPMIAVVDCQ